MARPGRHAAREGPSPALRFAGIAFALLMTATFGFSLLHPMAGSPDENAHQRYAYAVVTGQLPVGLDQRVSVPAYLVAEGPECWRFRAVQPATCATAEGTMRDAPPGTVRAVTQAANYPPLYDLIVGWPLRWLSGHPAIFATRFLSSLLFCVLTTAGLTVFAGRHPGLRGILGLATVTPAAAVMGAAINPQSLEIGAALFAAGCAWSLARPDARRTVSWGGLAVGSVLLILSRPSGPWWAVLLGVLVLVRLGASVRSVLKERGFHIYLATSALACVAYLAWGASAPTAPAYAGHGRPNCGWGCVSEHILSISAPSLRHMVGIAGWLDVVVPLALSTTVLVLFGMLIAGALALGDAWSRASLALGIVLLPLSAIVLEHAVVAEAGFMWQARYGLPLFLPLLWLAVDMLVGGAVRSGVPIVLVAVRSLGVVLVAADAGAYMGLAIRAARRFWLGSGSVAPLLPHIPVASAIGLAMVVGASLTGAVLMLADTLRVARASRRTREIAAGRHRRGAAVG